MKPRMSISIVIPNWNGKDLLIKHLPKVLVASPGCEIIVADDASVDGSVEWLHENFENIHVVANKKRQGFAGNINSGVACAKGDLVVLLNTDVEPEKGFLGPLLKHFTDVKVFAVGCLEKSYDPGGVVLRGRGIAKWSHGFFEHSRGDINKTTTAWVSGGSGAFNRKIWEKLGGMDNLFSPFYWEDIDLSYRALKAGYTIVFEPKSIINHYHEQGKIKSEYTSEEVKRISYRNQFIFIWKNLSDQYWIFLHCLWTPIKIFRAILSGDFFMLQGYAMAITKLLQIVKSRNRSSLHWRISDREIIST